MKVPGLAALRDPRRWRGRLRWEVDRLRNRLERADVHYVVENAAWSIRHDGLMITRRLPGLRGRITVQPAGLRDALVHFGSIGTFLARSGVARLPHRSNRVVVTWFHVEPEDGRLEHLHSVLGRVDLWHTSCRCTRDALAAAGVPPERLRIVPLGVDTRRFRPARAGERRAIRRVLGVPADHALVGSFVKDGSGWGEGTEPKMIKGPDILCETVFSLAAERPVHVLLTGPARGWVKRQLRQAGIPFTHLELRSPAGLGPLYRALDLYLVTSRAEGGPKPMLEAMASGIPVVTTPVGMAPDLFEHGVHALIAEPRHLAAEARALLDDPAGAATLAASGHERVRALDWDRIACRYERELYAPLGAGLPREGVDPSC